MDKNTVTEAFSNLRGRFTTLELSNSKRREKFCAKPLGQSEQYVTFYDVNGKRKVKRAKSSVTRIASGSTYTL